MRTRTRLTTPPGQEPDPGGGVRGADRERYVAGPRIPTEPRVPSRHRRARIRLAFVAFLLLAGWLTYLRVTAGQFQDPALTDLGPGTEAPVPAPTDPLAPTDPPTGDAPA